MEAEVFIISNQPLGVVAPFVSLPQGLVATWQQRLASWKKLGFIYWQGWVKVKSFANSGGSCDSRRRKPSAYERHGDLPSPSRVGPSITLSLSFLFCGLSPDGFLPVVLAEGDSDGNVEGTTQLLTLNYHLLIIYQGSLS